MTQSDTPFCWWKHGIVYHIYPQSFKDSNHDGIGDLPGIIEKLDYLSALGVDAIWLSPVYSSPKIDGGYDIADYRSIDPDYGTMDDFRQLLAKAHERNIRVIMDLVLNHTSDQHPWFRESRSSTTNARRNWYLWQPSRKGKRPTNWRTNFGKKAWRYDDLTGEYYYHSFFWEQPDLNWRNPEVKKEMFDIVEFWLREGVDGFRLDVINMLFKDRHWRDHSFFSGLGRKVYSRDQPEVYELLKEFRMLLDRYPGTASVGEIYAPPPGDPLLAAGFQGNGSDMLHLTFDFSPVFTRWRASAYSRVIRKWYQALPEEGWPCFFLSNHDVGRSIKRLGFTFASRSKAKLHAVLLLTLRGTPFIYYGEEIGMENAKIPRHKIRDLYGKLFYPFYKGRDGARTPMQWDHTGYAGFSTASPFLPVNENYPQVNVRAGSRNKHSVYRVYTRMIKLRKRYPVLQSGDISELSTYGGILAYSRFLDREELFVYLNFSWCRQKIRLRDPAGMTFLFSTHRRINSEVEEALVLAPYEGVVLRKT